MLSLETLIAIQARLELAASVDSQGEHPIRELVAHDAVYHLQSLICEIRLLRRLAETAEQLRPWLIEAPSGTAYRLDPAYQRINGQSLTESCVNFDAALAAWRSSGNVVLLPRVWEDPRPTSSG